MRCSVVRNVWLAVVLATAVWAGPFTNGSFETVGLGVDFGVYGIATLPFGDSASIPGWVVRGTNIDYILNPPSWVGAEGSLSLDLNGSGIGGIQQSFTTQDGGRYQVTFFMAGNPDRRPRTTTLRVTAGDSSALYSFSVLQGYSLSNMGWVANVFEFTAESTSTTLSFWSEDDSTCNDPVSPCAFGPALDNVSVNQIIPEPGTFALFGLGLVAAGFLRRLRR
ncbi:MAG: choice-of-anchor C family protein [Acidobacteriota bacterium]